MTWFTPAKQGVSGKATELDSAEGANFRKNASPGRRRKGASVSEKAPKNSRKQLRPRI